MEHIILAVGKLSESYWREACAEYVKRMGRYGGLRIEEIAEARLPKNPSPADIGRAVAKEGEDMLSRLPRRAFVCGLFIEGRQRSSTGLAQLLDELPQRGFSQAVFLIGGSTGMPAAVRRACHATLSFSPMTFPHQLMRVMLCEQLYRARSILAGTEYHK